MGVKRRAPAAASREAFLAEVQRDRAARDAGYREQALKLFPHVCGMCGREFAGKTLKELTVHHKDGNHFNNPADGSNWEMLCIYCHDQEHQTGQRRDLNAGGMTGIGRKDGLGFNAFEGLKQEDADE